MTELYLHIGMEETGTTSLQKFFALNREALEERGLLYPSFGRSYPKVSTDVNGFWLTRAETDEAYRMECFGEINRLAGQYGKILLSAECLWNNGAQEEAFWRELRAHLDTDIQIRPVAYIRRQDLFVYSRWSQTVKEVRAATMTFQEYIESGACQQIPLDYKEYFSRIAKVTGIDGILVRVYEPEHFKGGSLFEDFLDLIGVSANPADFDADSVDSASLRLPEEDLNISLKGVVLEAGRLLNAYPEYAETIYSLRPYLLRVQKTLEEEGRLYEQEGFTYAERIRFLESYQESNAWVAANLSGLQQGESPHGDGRLFQEPVPGDDAGNEPFTTAQIAEVYGRLVQELIQENRRIKRG